MSAAASPCVKLAMFSSAHAAEPRRRHGEPADGRLGVAVLPFGPQVHLVLLAGLVVGRHLIAADQQPQRLGRIRALHAEIGGLGPIEPHRHLGLAGAQRRVHVHQAGNLARLLGQRVAGALQLVEPRPLHHEHHVALRLPAAAAATAGDARGLQRRAHARLVASGGRISRRTSSMITN